MPSSRHVLLASALVLSCGALLLSSDSSTAPTPGFPLASPPRTLAAVVAEPAVPHAFRHRAASLVASRGRTAAPKPVVAQPPAAHPTAVEHPSREASSGAPSTNVAQQPAAAPATTPRRAAPAPPPRPAPEPSTAPPPPPRGSSGGNDYPYASAGGYPSDPWGFTERQCTSFVAWRLYQAGSALNNSSQGWGDASHWDDTARQRGRAVSTSPAVGAVAQWNAGESSAMYANGSSTPNGSFSAGSAGHVAWVQAVYSDGSVLVEQYNLSGNRSYSQMHVTAPRYLHL